jgi:dUTP pyrophosphatase
LRLSLRSSAPKKYGVMLANGIGIIDSDYYNNEENEGHIMFAIIAIKDTVLLRKGERIGQGVIEKYNLTDDDMAEGLRTGGFGSTNLMDAFDAIFNTDSLKAEELE